MKLPLLALQKAVFKRLNKNISCEVYDNINVDENGNITVQFPFVRLGDTTVTDYGTKTEDVTNCTYTINVFSQHKSQVECKKILNEIVEQITNDLLVLEGFEVLVTYIDSVRILEEFDTNLSNNKKTITYHGVIVLRLIIKEEY